MAFSEGALVSIPGHARSERKKPMSIAKLRVLSTRREHRRLLQVAGPIGWALAAIALITLAYELSAYAETGRYRVIPVGELWFNVHVASLNLIQAVVQRYLHPFLWDPIITAVLQWPAWSLLGAPAAILVAVAPKRTA
jgi:hypothetical protein